MKVFLIALAGTIVGILLLVVIAIWLIKRWLKKTFSPLMDAFKAFVPEPMRISLTPATEVQVSDQAAFDAAAADFEALGFSRVGTYTTNDIPGLTLAAFVLPQKQAYGVVYDLRGQPPWFDLVTSYQDGRACTYSNLRETGADQPPWSTSVKSPGKPLVEVFQAFLQGRPAGEMKPTSPLSFARDFEDSYARQMDWRIARGVDENEVRRVAKAGNISATEEEINLTVTARRAQRDGQIEDAVRKDYLKASRIPAIEWQAMSERTTVIADGMLTDGPARCLIRAMGLDVFTDTDDPAEEAQADANQQKRREFEELLQERGVRQGFAALAAQHLPPGSARILTTCEKPVPADLWLLPSPPDAKTDA
ncbi:MAG: hypothetical protein U0637_14135 [Phycisphaerales bacterium]